MDDLERWRAYILDSLVDTTLARDVLLLRRIDKPALLRQLFRLGCDLSAQVVSYQKLVGQLQDAGNTTTLANYLRILGDAGRWPGWRSTPAAARASTARAPGCWISARASSRRCGA